MMVVESFPGHHDIVRTHAVGHIVATEGRSIGESFRYSALRGDTVYLGIAVILARECDGSAVRREAGEHFVADVTCQSACNAT